MIGSLPHAYAREYGLEWDATGRRRIRLLTATIATARPLVPQPSAAVLPAILRNGSRGAGAPQTTPHRQTGFDLPDELQVTTRSELRDGRLPTSTRRRASGARRPSPARGLCATG